MKTIHIRELVCKYPAVKAMIKTMLYPAVIARRSLLRKKYLWQKEVINNLGEKLVGDPIIKVDEFQGIFAVGVHSDLFYRLIIQKEYEPQQIKLCLKPLLSNKTF